MNAGCMKGARNLVGFAWCNRRYIGESPSWLTGQNAVAASSCPLQYCSCLFCLRGVSRRVRQLALLFIAPERERPEYKWD